MAPSAARRTSSPAAIPHNPGREQVDRALRSTLDASHAARGTVFWLALIDRSPAGGIDSDGPKSGEPATIRATNEPIVASGAKIMVFLRIAPGTPGRKTKKRHPGALVNARECHAYSVLIVAH